MESAWISGIRSFKASLICRQRNKQNNGSVLRTQAFDSLIGLQGFASPAKSRKLPWKEDAKCDLCGMYGLCGCAAPADFGPKQQHLLLRAA